MKWRGAVSHALVRVCLRQNHILAYRIMAIGYALPPTTVCAGANRVGARGGTRGGTVGVWGAVRGPRGPKFSHSRLALSEK